MLGRFDDARRDLESVEEYASLISDFLQGYCWYSLAYIQIQYEAYSQAMWYSERCTREFKESNNFLMYAKSLSLSATIHSRIGRISEAKQLYLLADNVLEKFNADESALLRTRLSLADVCETLGELGDAEKWTEKALFCSNSSHDYVALSALSRIRARLFYKRGDLLTARTEVNASIAFSEQCNDVWSLGWSYLLASGIFEEYDTKVTLATKAFQITEGSQYTLLGAMSAERLASLCEGTEKEGYLRKAMAAYRAYISKSTDVSNVEDIVFGVRGKSRQL